MKSKIKRLFKTFKRDLKYFLKCCFGRASRYATFPPRRFYRDIYQNKTETKKTYQVLLEKECTECPHKLAVNNATSCCTFFAKLNELGIPPCVTINMSCKKEER